MLFFLFRDHRHVPARHRNTCQSHPCNARARNRSRISRRRARKQPASVFPQVLQSIMYCLCIFWQFTGWPRRLRRKRGPMPTWCPNAEKMKRAPQPQKPETLSIICNYWDAHQTQGLIDKGNDPLSGVQKWLPEVLRSTFSGAHPELSDPIESLAPPFLPPVLISAPS